MIRNAMVLEHKIHVV